MTLRFLPCNLADQKARKAFSRAAYFHPFAGASQLRGNLPRRDLTQLQAIFVAFLQRFLYLIEML